MRAAAVAAFALLLSSSCANRGMKAPDHDAGATGGKGGAGGRGGGQGDGGPDATGTAGAGGNAGRGGATAGAGGRAGGSAGAGGRSGSGGATAGTGGRGGGTAGAGGSAGGGAAGTGRGGSGGSVAGSGGSVAGSGGSPIVDAGCLASSDAAVVPGPCNATFNFETSTQGARLGTTQGAFQTPVNGGALGYCGKALAIPATFTGPTDKGEVIIPLGSDGGAVDLTGKTITISIAADPGCDADLDIFLVVNTQSLPVMFSIPSVSGAWMRRTFTPTTTDVSASIALSLQAFSITGYKGTLYIDEIDIK
jgi:hypothetical protein